MPMAANRLMNGYVLQDSLPCVQWREGLVRKDIRAGPGLTWQRGERREIAIVSRETIVEVWPLQPVSKPGGSSAGEQKNLRHVVFLLLPFLAFIIIFSSLHGHPSPSYRKTEHEAELSHFMKGAGWSTLRVDWWHISIFSFALTMISGGSCTANVDMDGMATGGQVTFDVDRR
jgi:hypothetical protein